MPRPSKIPITFAYYVLNSSNRGYEHRPENVKEGELEEIAVNNELLVPVSKLRKYFASKRFFDEFKNSLSVPDNFWNQVTRLNSGVKKYAKRFMNSNKRGRPRTRKGSHKIVAKIGNFSEDEISNADSETSLISIAPSDEADDTDVRFPRPTCKGIRKVCREYSSSHRYLPYPKDSSENKRYHINVNYDEP